MPTHNPQTQALLAEFQNKAAASERGLAAQGFSPEQKDLLRGLWDELQTPMFEVWLVSLQAGGASREEPSGTFCREIPGYELFLCTDEKGGVSLASKKDVAGWTLKAQTGSARPVNKESHDEGGEG
jgi:hypothetical protein